MIVGDAFKITQIMNKVIQMEYNDKYDLYY